MKDDHVRGELFNKIRVDSTGDPLALLKQGEGKKEAVELMEAKKIFTSVIEITNNDAIRYSNKNTSKLNKQTF